VIEINQAGALAGGINGSAVSDPPGYPVVITQPGSYRLTSDLLPGAQTAIRIDSSDVSVDLNHFSIRGSWTLLATCGTGTTGLGVYADATRKGISVRNGRVHGMSVHGIVMLGDLARVEDVTAFENCVTGVFVGRNALVSDTQSSGNLGHGIVTDGGSIVVRSLAAGNGLYGILGNGSGIMVSDSVAEGNSEAGIRVVADGTVARSVSRANAGGGILATLVVESVAIASPTSGATLITSSGMAHDIAQGGTGPSVAGKYLGCVLLGGIKTCD
jgi:hypothetical protein